MKNKLSPVALIRSKNVSKAFTLIELLVVIAIIAILAAILFPVFARARENARRSSCQSNLKQIGLGVLQYVQDYDEKYPFGHNQGGGASGGYLNWYSAVDPYLKSRQIFSCPSDSNTDHAGNTDYMAGGAGKGWHVSYAANYFVSKSSDDPQLSLAAVASASTLVYAADAGVPPTGPKGTVVEGTAEKKFDGLRLLSDAGWPGLNGVTTNPGDNNFMGPTIRHLSTTNVLFADGHVKALKANAFYWKLSWMMHPECDNATNVSPCFDLNNAPA